MQNADITAKPLKLFIIIGLAMAILLNIVNYFVLDETWLVFLRSLIIFSGLFYIFAFDGKHNERLIITSLILALASALMVGWPFSVAFTTLIVLAIYALNCFQQVYHHYDSVRVPYSALFENVWNNFCLLFSAQIFTLLAWGILALWAGLFSGIGIEFFSDIFFTSAFAWFITPIMFVMGLYITYDSVKIVTYLRFIFLGFCKILLPLMTIIGICYLGYWTFHGFNIALTQDNKITYTLIPFFIYVGVIFTNAVYQDGRDSVELSVFYRITVNIFVVVLFLLSIMSSYLLITNLASMTNSTHLINTLTFPLLITNALLLLYTACYSAAVIVKSSRWLSAMEPCNIYLAWVLILTAITLNNPLTETVFKVAQVDSTVTKKTYTALDVSQYKVNWHKPTAATFADAIVTGYDRQGEPIFVCRSKMNDVYIPGEYRDKQCSIALQNRDYKPTDYTILVGPGKILWSGSPDFKYSKGKELIVGVADNKPYAICRAIYNNQIRIGNSYNYKCYIAVDGNVITMPFSGHETLYVVK